MAERIVTREQAAKRLNCSMRTIERMLRDGRLGAVRREDGRLSVDPDDFARVLADPGLLEQRRGTPAPQPSAPSQVVEPVLPPKAPTARLERVTPLGGPSETHPSPPGHARGRRVSRRASAFLVALLAIAGASIAIAIFHSSASNQTPRQSGGVATRLGPVLVPASAGGRVDTRVAVSAPRGGHSLTITEPGTKTAAPTPRASQPAPPAPKHVRAATGASATNCGFGSLTLGAC